MGDGFDGAWRSSPLVALSSSTAYGDDPHARLFEPLIGSWTVESVWFDETGTTIRRAGGEWHFAWVLGGLGVQDVLYVAGTPKREWGTTLRTYDAQERTWRVVWMQPHGREWVALTARGERGDIVHTGRPLSEPDGPVLRWTFRSIESESFEWSGEVVDPTGRTRVEQLINATRQEQRPAVQ